MAERAVTTGIAYFALGSAHAYPLLQPAFSEVYGIQSERSNKKEPRDISGIFLQPNFRFGNGSDGLMAMHQGYTYIYIYKEQMNNPRVQFNSERKRNVIPLRKEESISKSN